MSSMEGFEGYLGMLEKRLRLALWTRGGAVVALCALSATLLLVLYTNAFAFSAASVTAARFLLCVCLALAVALGVILPLVRLTRTAVARRAEREFPEFGERLLTLAERSRGTQRDPFLELLADDALRVAPPEAPERLAAGRRIAAAVSAAAGGAGVLIWLIAAGPGFLGHGAALLWGVPTKSGSQAFYEIKVEPGDASVRKGGDQMVTAALTGFETASVKLAARFAGTTKWETVPMVPREGAPGFQFLFAGLGDSVEYYVEAGGMRSPLYRLTVVDLPALRRVRVTYRYPGWLGLKDVVQENQGDLRAVENTLARVEMEFDRPLREGVLEFDGAARIPLVAAQGNWYAATVRIEADGVYHAAAVEGGKTIRLSEDFFIEVRKETPPVVQVRRPGRDIKVNPIQEVTVEVQAEDDFALEGLQLHYSVNGGAERTVPLLERKGGKQASGSALIALEDYRLSPGDIVSFYASARDARSTARSDIYFLEAQPYEREYSQSQVMGGMEGGGEGEEGGRNEISRRQKEIIAATWNQMRDNSGNRAAAAENGKFLSEVQGKLRDQARSLARRMQSRQLSSENEEFKKFTKEMESAADAMNAAADKLKALNWREALPSEQRALQHLLRAEAVFREIQVAMGSRNQRGGGSGGGGRDLENMFDLELDLEKNQYEAGQQAASSPGQRQREIDEALQKLEQLARRQQELAEQQRRERQSFQQRWQQEMLRREAEQLQRQMQQLAQQSGQQSQQQGQQSQQQGGQASSQSSSQQSSQQSASRQSGQQQQQSQTGQRLSALAGRNDAGEQRLRQALDELRRATDDMRRAASAEPDSSDARRAAERLQQARDLVNGMRREGAASQLDDLAGRGERLASQQRQFAEELKRAYGNSQEPSKVPQQALDRLAEDKQRMLEELQRLEKDMQAAARDLAGTQRGASNRLREALGEMQQNELAVRMRFGAEWVRRGYGPMMGSREAVVTQGLERLRDQLRGAREAMEGQPAQPGQEGFERALAQVEQLRAQLERGGGAAGGNDIARQWNTLRRWVAGHPELRHDGIDGLRNLEVVDPNRVPNLTAQIVPALRHLELVLRRKIEEQQAGQVRTAPGDPIPPGYSGAVAEYFRRLSKP